jgi:hypothetical protein
MSFIIPFQPAFTLGARPAGAPDSMKCSDRGYHFDSYCSSQKDPVQIEGRRRVGMPAKSAACAARVCLDGCRPLLS